MENDSIKTPINLIDSGNMYSQEYLLSSEMAEKCSKYHVTFKKADNGTYYFDSIKQVK